MHFGSMNGHSLTKLINQCSCLHSSHQVNSWTNRYSSYLVKYHKVNSGLLSLYPLFWLVQADLLTLLYSRTGYGSLTGSTNSWGAYTRGLGKNCNVSMATWSIHHPLWWSIPLLNQVMTEIMFIYFFVEVCFVICHAFCDRKQQNYKCCSVSVTFGTNNNEQKMYSWKMCCESCDDSTFPFDNFLYNNVSVFM